MKPVGRNVVYNEGWCSVISFHSCIILVFLLTLIFFCFLYHRFLSILGHPYLPLTHFTFFLFILVVLLLVLLAKISEFPYTLMATRPGRCVALLPSRPPAPRPAPFRPAPPRSTPRRHWAQELTSSWPPGSRLLTRVSTATRKR